MIEQTVLFCLGTATNLGERNLWNQTSSTLLKYWPCVVFCQWRWCWINTQLHLPEFLRCNLMCIIVVVIFQTVVLILIVVSWNTTFRPLYPLAFLSCPLFIWEMIQPGKSFFLSLTVDHIAWTPCLINFQMPCNHRMEKSGGYTWNTSASFEGTLSLCWWPETELTLPSPKKFLDKQMKPKCQFIRMHLKIATKTFARQGKRNDFHFFLAIICTQNISLNQQRYKFRYNTCLSRKAF